MAVTFTKPLGNDTAFFSREGIMLGVDIAAEANLPLAETYVEKPKKIPVQVDLPKFNQVLNMRAGATDPLHSRTSGDIAIQSISVGGQNVVRGLAFIETDRGGATISKYALENVPTLGGLNHRGPTSSMVQLGGNGPTVGSGGLNLTIKLVARNSGGKPNVNIDGLHKLVPHDYFSPGPVRNTPGDDGYDLEYDICVGRSKANAPMIVDRYDKAVRGCESKFDEDGLDDPVALNECINDAYILYDPNNAEANCLDSCLNGGHLADGSHCYDERYHLDGGRLPNLYHAGWGGCGCGSDKHEGCDFAFLAYTS